MSSVGERVKFIRDKCGIKTQNEFSYFLGLSKAQGKISRIEKNEIAISDALYALIESKTGFSRHWIKTGEGPMRVEGKEENHNPLLDDPETAWYVEALKEGEVEELTETDIENIRNVYRTMKGIVDKSRGK